MRVTRRTGGIEDYWHRRWSNIPVDDAMTANRYPLEQALRVVRLSDQILEAGCGAGRLLRYFHDRGYDIVGCDYIPVAVDKLKAADATLQVRQADIRALPFRDEQFNVVLAFGLYHGLEEGRELALLETKRVMATGGKLVASFRADNWQNRINDALKEHQSKRSGQRVGGQFHKVNLTRDEVCELLSNCGFAVQEIAPIVNMPLLFQFRIFRSSRQKRFSESLARRDGYELNLLGKLLNSSPPW